MDSCESSFLKEPGSDDKDHRPNHPRRTSRPRNHPPHPHSSSSIQSEPDSGSQSKNGRSDHPRRDHSPSPSQSHGVTIDTLPREIVIHILSRLPAPSLFRAQFVCRSWRVLVQDPLLLQLHRPGAASSHDPTVIFHSDHPLRSQLYFVDDISEGDGRHRLVRKFHPPYSIVTPEFDVVGSSEGLLCLANAMYSDDVYVYNPLAGEYRELLDLEARQRSKEMVLGFGFDETEKDYKAIKIVHRITDRFLPPAAASPLQAHI
ncbi:F-box protein At3g07870-like [Rhodamnia argentea]|uniref:F-box protein At3g07870-like n=1 Tax=Rhodamnia argentea TaxID=178133 RepID=A0A8B8PXZ4_9MYRT|nr:F-box protein At3g07870-like [Rhodamnia argentea]